MNVGKDAQGLHLPFWVFARNFRGFRNLNLRVDGVNFFVGDNSSGKSSALHLIDCISRTTLRRIPSLNDELGVSEYDFFSPFLNNADVTMGFKTADNSDGNGNSKTKIITLKKKRGAPKLHSVTYLSNSYRVSLKVRGNKTLYKVGRGDFCTLESCYRAHDERSGFTESDIEAGHEDIADPGLVLYALRKLPETEMHDVFQAITNSTPSTGFIGPIRSLPEKYYDFSRKFSSMGLHFASMLLEMRDESELLGDEAAKRFGQSSGLFDRLTVKRISKSAPFSPIVVSIERNGKEFLLNQVGVGVSQVIPVIAESLFSLQSQGNRISLIQQPELHLHPRAQAAMGTLFFDLWKLGWSATLETHSSFLIDRFRSHINEDEAHQPNENLDLVRTIFFENTKSGNIATEIPLSGEGHLVDAPDSYHRFFIDEAMRNFF